MLCVTYVRHLVPPLRAVLHYWWRRPPVKNSRGILKYDWQEPHSQPIIFQNSPRILDRWPSPPVVYLTLSQSYFRIPLEFLTGGLLHQ
jgi:hypothetical protein